MTTTETTTTRDPLSVGGSDKWTNKAFVEPQQKVWFLPNSLENPVEILGPDGEAYSLKPGEPVLIPRDNALALETHKVGRVLTSADDIVKHVFLSRVSTIPDQPPRDGGSTPTFDGGGRQPAAVHLEYSKTSDTSEPHHDNVVYLDQLQDLEFETFFYSENYTDIEPSPRLLELAEKLLGYSRADFLGFVEKYFPFTCGIHTPIFLKVGGGYLNPNRRQRGSRESAKDLVVKLIQLNHEAKVLERDRRKGVLRVLEKNNLYLLPMELTYPHELNSLFISLLKEDPNKLKQLRDNAVNLFFQKLLELEFGEYAQFSEFIYWVNNHDWGTKQPNKAHFHEHINLLNVTYDWRGSPDFKALRRALNQILTPTPQDIAEITGWSLSKVWRVIRFFKGKELIGLAKGRIGTFVHSSWWDIPSPLVRFNPEKFKFIDDNKDAEKLLIYRSLWKEAIEEVFGVELCCLPVVHFPKKLIPLDIDHWEKLVNRFAYCSRHPVVDINNFLYGNPDGQFDDFWLKHLLEFKPRRGGSKVAKKLSKYVDIDFLSTLKGRYYRLRAKFSDLLLELDELEARERELVNKKSYGNLESFEFLQEIEKELKKIAERREEIGEEIGELITLGAKVRELKERYKHYPKCPICGNPMHPIELQPPSDTPLVYFDTVVKKWAVKFNRLRG